MRLVGVQTSTTPSQLRNTATLRGEVIYMQLLTKELLKKLPKLGAIENEKDPLVICKFFTPDAHWTWYVVAFDGKDTFFGFVAGDFPERGYFSLSELQQVRGALGLPVERDLYFEPMPLSEVEKLHPIPV
jgi:hypothetical protein